MLKRIPINAPRTLGICAEDTVSKDDYESVLIPLLEKMDKKGERVRFLFQFGPDFKGVTLGAAWDDLRAGVKFYHLFEKCAIVSDVEWVCHASLAFGIFWPCPVKVFKNSELKDAIEWITNNIS